MPLSLDRSEAPLIGERLRAVSAQKAVGTRVEEVTDAGDYALGRGLIRVTLKDASDRMELLHFTDLLKYGKRTGRSLRMSGEQRAGGIDATRSDRRQTLAKGRGLDGKHVGSIFALQVEHVTQHVCDAPLAIEAEQHCLCTSDLYFLLEERHVRVAIGSGQRFSKPAGKLVAESSEGQLLTLHATLSDAKQVVRRDAIHPGRKRALAPKSA
jgi:hypothetical protein